VQQDPVAALEKLGANIESDEDGYISSIYIKGRQVTDAGFVRLTGLTKLKLNDEIAVRFMMPLSLSYDHRQADGATAARFLNQTIGYLKAPSRLLFAL